MCWTSSLDRNSFHLLVSLLPSRPLFVLVSPLKRNFCPLWICKVTITFPLSFFPKVPSPLSFILVNSFQGFFFLLWRLMCTSLILNRFYIPSSKEIIMSFLHLSYIRFLPCNYPTQCSSSRSRVDYRRQKRHFNPPFQQTILTVPTLLQTPLTLL